MQTVIVMDDLVVVFGLFMGFAENMKNADYYHTDSLR